MNSFVVICFLFLLSSSEQICNRPVDVGGVRRSFARLFASTRANRRAHDARADRRASPNDNASIYRCGALPPTPRASDEPGDAILLAAPPAAYRLVRRHRSRHKPASLANVTASDQTTSETGTLAQHFSPSFREKTYTHCRICVNTESYEHFARSAGLAKAFGVGSAMRSRIAF